MKNKFTAAKVFLLQYFFAFLLTDNYPNPNEEMK